MGRPFYVAMAALILVTAGGAAWITQINVRLGFALGRIERLDSHFEEHVDIDMPTKYLGEKMDDLKTEDLRLQLQLDRIEHRLNNRLSDSGPFH
jgi:hypothetical protein